MTKQRKEQLVVAGLDRDELTENASQQTGLDDFGDIPFEEPLTVLVDALEREAKLDDARREQTRGTLVGLLIKRLQLVNDRKLHPQIADEVVDSPIFIVGAPRTGSTHLHALMGRAEGIRVPLFWEQSMPSPPPERETYETDPRIAKVQAMVDQIPAEMLTRHPIAPNRPEQCNLLTDWSFINFAQIATYEVPTYRNWLFNADHRPAYETHRRTLQHLQWRTPGQWVLKYPKHLLALDALLDTYPDARFIWTHRDPAVVIPSVASFTGYIRSPTPGYDPKLFGPEWATYEELVMRRGIGVRDSSAADDRSYDVYYGELMRDTIGTMEGIYAHFGMDFSDGSRRQVQAWIDDHPKTKHGVHTYTPEDFGLSADGLHRRFGFYMDRFGIEPEKRRTS